MQRSVAESEYLAYQYSDPEKLRVRADTHRLYSEQPDRLRDLVIAQLMLSPGLNLLDVGCGPGGYHSLLAQAGVHTVGLDTSDGMLREARARAGANGLMEHPVCADAQELPFRDATFDRVLAAHVLYHVGDIAAALREIRRVLRRGGQAVLVTNGAQFLSRLERLHRDAASALGYVPTAGDGSRFTLEELPLVQSVFPKVERHVLDNALVFNDPEPVLSYYASGVIDRLEERPIDGSHRTRLLPLVRDGVTEIIAREGAFRDPKPTGCLVAEVV